MKTNINGLRLCRKDEPVNPEHAGATTNAYPFPGSERPPMSFPEVVFMAILYLLFAFYTAIMVKDLMEGKEPPILDSGAPRPCAPPSHGIWPECREAAHR